MEYISPALAVVVAWLVYKLSADKFYAELLERRLIVFHDLLESIENRQIEAQRINIYNKIDEVPQQEQYFATARLARALFGQEVEAAIATLEKRYLRWITAMHVLRDQPGEEARSYFLQALQDLEIEKSNLAERIKPYVRLNHGGLPLRTVASIKLASWRRSRSPSRVSEHD